MHRIIYEDHPYLVEKMQKETHQNHFHETTKWLSRVPVLDRHVNVLCGGTGLFSVPLILSHNAQSVKIIDIDPTLHDISYHINEQHKHSYSHQISNITFDRDHIRSAHIWVNTHCHRVYPKNIFNKNSIVILAGNNKQDRGHINPINSTEELADMYEIVNILDEYTTQYDGYEQHTIIGKSNA